MDTQIITILLIVIVILSIAIGALLEHSINCQEDNNNLIQSNSEMSQIIRQANIQDVAPKKIKD